MESQSEKTMQAKGNGKHLLYLLKTAWQLDKELFGIYFLYTFFVAVRPFISLFSVKWLIDELMGESRLERMALILGFFLVAGMIVNFFCVYLKNMYQPRLILVRFKFINILQVKSMTMDFKYTEDPKILNDLENAWQAVSSNYIGIEGIFNKLFEMSGNIVSILAYVSLLFILSPWVLLYLMFNMILTYWLTTKAKAYEFKHKDQTADLSRRMMYLYSTMSDFKFGKDIRIYHLAPWLSHRYQDIRNERLNLTKKIQFHYLWVLLIDTLLVLIREGLVYGYLIYCVLVRGLSLGNFSMYFNSVNQFTSTLKTVMDDLAHLRLQFAYVNHFREFLLLEEEPPLSNSTPLPVMKPYCLEFKNVSFKYPNSDRYIFKNLSFKIKAGERLAIVGVNGAGKTTLVKLMTRLYEPIDGEILLDGINVKQFDRKAYYDLFSVVFQDVKVLAFTVAENVAAKSLQVLNEEQVKQCLKRAGLLEKIESLPKGMNTMMLKGLEDDGIELSGGQNQKLALARALYKNGEIVILDEPTAALDPLAEAEIYESFNDLIGHKTAIYISHRLSSTRFCDAIAFFENGEILEYGTHEELLAKDGRYAEMFRIQSQYYQEQEEGVAI